MSTCSPNLTPLFSSEGPASFSSSLDQTEFSTSPSSYLPPEGYLILTFNKYKQAKVQSAAFADVSEAGLQDDDAIYDEAEEELTTCSMNTSSLSQLPQATSAVAPLTISTALTLSPSTGLSRLAAVATAACLGVDVSQITQTASMSSNSSYSQSSSNRLRDNVRRFTYPDGDTHYDLLSCPLTDMQAKIPSAMDECKRTSSLVYDSSLQSPRRHRASFPLAAPSSQTTLCRKMLRCEECGKYYRNEYSLHHHICLKRKDVWKKGDIPSQLIDGQVIYFCPICRKPFKWLGNLTRHYYVHTGQRFFKCDICQKEFFSAYQVRRHMNSHTGLRFTCEICDKPFTCKYACAWHTRQHSECVG